MIMSLPDISVVIPTYCREQILIDTLEMLRPLLMLTDEVIVVDQTPTHDTATEAYLCDLEHASWLHWVKLAHPSIPIAMNHGLRVARNRIVLFLDDDIVPDCNLLNKHRKNFVNSDVWAVSGQILQPDEEPIILSTQRCKKGLYLDMDFRFNTNSGCEISNVMAGNLSVHREAVMEVGGFDENFIGVAYRFETEFARRILQYGGKIIFEPSASIRHLRSPSGGTRRYGNHLTSASPMHGVGDYYFALRQGISTSTMWYMLLRPFREIRTRFHLRAPWWIPVKLIGEVRALLLAVKLYLKGPRLMREKK